ncbi:GDSL esterase/lipase At5g55050 [Linum grandiflorum]
MAPKFGLLSTPAAIALALYYFLWVVILNNPLLCSSESNCSSVAGLFMLGGFSHDVGQNNYLDTSVKGNQPFNGIDFPGSVSTGRFSNGRNLADVVAALFCYDLSPPPYFVHYYSDNFIESVLATGGANMASGGSGVFNVTRFSEVIPLGQQVDQLLTIFSNLTSRLGKRAAADYLNRSVCVIASGSGNIIEQAVNRTALTDNIFLNRLVLQLLHYVRTIYTNGLRRFAIVSPPPLGCSPNARTFSPTGGCIRRANTLVEGFMDRLSLAMEVQRLLSPGLRYAIGDAYRVNLLFIDNPQPFGFTNVTAACCGNGTTPCTPTSTLCGNSTIRNQYVYWNQYLLTERAATLTANFFASGNNYVSPITFPGLVES